ncbi:hypothetical protein CPB86DRAFT_797547 [Serendipita vermifera]|nr:hypothetical protein CPB86DRAFT_797547 [Serendipita vermifera]
MSVISEEGNYRKKSYRDDASELDRAMEEHGPAIVDSFQDRAALVRGIVSNLQTNGHKKKSHRKSSNSTSTTHTPKNHRNPQRSTSLSYTSSTSPSVDEISLLINRLANERQKTASLQASLTQVQSEVAFQSKRLEDAETRVADMKKKEEEANTRRKKMEVEFGKVKEQLRFLKTQYDGAVAEITKAQKEIDALDEERHRAVEEAVREREKVRRLLEERKLREAREEGYQEGKRLGMEEGVKMGKQEGKKYGVRDGKEAERERQKRAMMDLVRDDEPYEDNPIRPGSPLRMPSPQIRETYNIVDTSTPGPDERPVGLGRSQSLNVGPSVAPAGRIAAPVVALDPKGQTANIMGLPVMPNGPTSFPLYEQSNRPFAEPPNPHTNILTSAPEFPEPAAPITNSNRTSAPPRINATPPDKRSWGGGPVGTGQGHRRHRSSSGGTQGGGRGIVTPPSVSSQGRSTPMDQYDLFDRDRHNPDHRGTDRRGNSRDHRDSLGGFRQPVNEMTPITEAGSEPGPSPVKAYFGDAAMGIRPAAHAMNDVHHSANQHHQYAPPRLGSPEPSPAIAMTQRSNNNERAHQSTQPHPSSQHRHTQRKPVPHQHLNGNTPTPARHPPGGPGNNGRASSAMANRNDVPAALPPIEINTGTPPTISKDRSTKMAMAGPTLMGSPAFVTKELNYGTGPDPGSRTPHNNFATGHGAFTQPQNRREVGPNGTPLASPKPMRSPLLLQRDITVDDVRESDPSGGQYRPSSSQQYGFGGQRNGRASANGMKHQKAASMNTFGTQYSQPPRSPRFDQQQAPPSPSQFAQHSRPPSSNQSNPNLAHPTPRRYSSALDMSPEEIAILPSGLTPVSDIFNTKDTYRPGSTQGHKGKGRASAEEKKRRREGFVDYDDEIPQIRDLGYVQEQEPPQTTRSQVQSLYGIPKTPKGPMKTPRYEAAPSPPPKSARMLGGRLPHQPQPPPEPSPQRSQSSSHYRREMEADLDTPIQPYDPSRAREEEMNPNVLDIDILDEKADDWDQRSGKFLPHKPSQSFSVVPPVNASPARNSAPQDPSFLRTGDHPRPPPSPSVSHRGPPEAYVNTAAFDDSAVIPRSYTVDRYGNPVPSPQRQSLPITASARSSSQTLPPVKASDIPWATNKTTTSQLPRQSVYEAAPPASASIPPNTATTWGYVRDSGQSLAPVGPIGGGLGFTFGSNNASLDPTAYALAKTSPVSTGHMAPIGLPPSSARVPSAQLPPQSTRSNIMDLAPGSTRSNIMQIPGTARSNNQPLAPGPTQSQVILTSMLSPDPVGPEPDDDPIIPGGAAKKKKKAKRR